MRVFRDVFEPKCSIKIERTLMLYFIKNQIIHKKDTIKISRQVLRFRISLRSNTKSI